jgi:hypothetical protein
VSEPFLLGANMDMIDLVERLQARLDGPAIDSRECLGSVVSNGRIFYISQASGLETSLLTGRESATLGAPWDRR